MSLRISIPAFCLRAGAIAAVVLLAGCAHPAEPVVEVTSPPPPRFGSGPIVAYDAYAAPFYTAPTAVATATSAGSATEAKGSDSLEGILN